MKKARIRKEYIHLYKIIALVLALWLLVMALLWNGFDRGKEIYLNSEQNALESKVQATLKTYEVFSNYIYEDKINREEVLALMYQANHTQGQAQDLVRSDLFDLLSPSYDTILAYNFRQLHFHLPDSSSFLRMHRPDKYGDSLLGIRETVRLANDERRYIFGFEEGRIYNGYRFVYPLSYREEAIGSVEVSLSMSTLIEILNQQYPDIDTYFILDGAIIKSKVFDDELDNYMASDCFEGYFFDKEVYGTSTSGNQLLSLEDTQNVFKQIKNDFSSNHKESKDFTLLTTLHADDYLVQFFPITNISGEAVGYFIALEKNYAMRSEKNGFITQCFLVTLLMIFFIGASLVFTRYQIKVTELSVRDNLTGLYNRHKFNEVALNELNRSKRYGSIFCLLMVDIDFFKRVNDTYGHLKGDLVLKELAQLMLTKLRVTDLVSRWGGEEFICCLPNMSKDQAEVVAEKLRRAVEDYDFPHVGHITISIGVTLVDQEDHSLDAPIARADEALYKSKNNGRNQYTIL